MNGEQDTRHRLFFANVAMRAKTNTNTKSVCSRATNRALGTKASERDTETKSALQGLFDVDCNLCHPALKDMSTELLDTAAEAGVCSWLVPGSCLEDSFESIQLAEKYSGGFDLYSTMGVHPYNVVTQAATFPLQETLAVMRKVAPQVVAIGECGMDLSEGFPSCEEQLPWFEGQVALACELGMPLFLHERLAHEQVMQVLDAHRSQLPPVLVHCFTGTAAELQTYLDMGFYVSFAGLICRSQAGKGLRDAISQVAPPLDRVMVETDAPYLGFPGCRKSHGDKKKVFPNLPCALPQVVTKLSEVLQISPAELGRAATANAVAFFKLKR
eukprot:CAMPEP_0184540206 /NCGR_PEP_ID=MMETSP0198_2-20121128/18528_1 /TAXON_ID=1112570 /ORGANISM="Thraustochytrium sp., Strain LLF1b" /LENGTH=327 /DNA_ID=CAMNT_0026933757 /DNA_START=804 /DNA_END=1787 /DNA_ORIENTATION=+